MKKQFLLSALIGLIAFSCSSAVEEEAKEKTQKEKVEITNDERAFLDNLISLCNKTFEGKQTFMIEERESWEEKNFIMHVVKCDANEVHIPFHLDEDKSRTWMFLVDEKGLRFRHDHRYEDGTPEEKTLYGGYADGKGTQFRQHFPIDNYSVNLLEDNKRKRQWNVVLSEDMSTFSYKLLYHDELIFQADFDLTKPIKK